MMRSFRENLDQRVVGVSFDELAPHEDHGRARCHAQQDHAGDVLACQLGIHPGGEYMPKKQYAQCCHAEGLDQPVHHKREHQTLRLLPYILHRVPVDLDHHRIDHHPDEDGDDQVDLRYFKRRHCLENTGQHKSQTHPDGNAQRHPDRQIPLKQTHRYHAIETDNEPFWLLWRLHVPKN